MELKQFRQLQWGFFGAAVIAAIWFLMPAIRFSLAMFNDPTEDMGYGWAVPFGAAFILWLRRDKLSKTMGAPTVLAWSGILLSLLLFFFGARGGQDRLMQLAFIGLFFSIPWACFGWRFARWLILPSAYLVFAIPMGFLDNLTFHLRLFSTVLSEVLLNGCGIGVVRVGTALHSTSGNPFQLGVADPCSGIRSIIAIMAITSIFGEMTQNRLWKKWLLFFCSVPLAILGNVVRVFSTAFVASIWGQNAGMAWHDQAGFLVFPVVLLCVFGLSDLLRRIGPGAEIPIEPVVLEMPRFPKVALGMLGLIPVVLLAAGVWIGQMPPVKYESDGFVAAELPTALPGYTASVPLFCQNEACLFSMDSAENEAAVCPHCGSAMDRVSKPERNILPKDTTILKTAYQAEDDVLMSISLVMSGKSRLSIHRPEMCLPGQGFVLTPSRVVSLDLGEGRSLKVNVMKAEHPNSAPSGFVYWFFNSRGEAATHWERIFTDVWWRTVNNEINRWCMVTLRSNLTFETEGDIRRLEAFLREWYPQVCLREKTP